MQTFGGASPEKEQRDLVLGCAHALELVARGERQVSDVPLGGERRRLVVVLLAPAGPWNSARGSCIQKLESSPRRHFRTFVHAI